MANGTQDVYDAAVAEYIVELSESERDDIRKLDSVEGFLDHVGKLKGGYAQKRASFWFERLRPVLDWLWQFNSSVQSFLQASPESFVLVWGSLSVVLQLCQSYAKRLDLLLDCLETIKDTQPRFNLYSLYFTPLSIGLRDSLIRYHLELLHFFHSAIKFFQNSFYRNFWHTSFRRVHSTRLRKLESLAYTIDREANCTGQLRILELVSPNESTVRNHSEMFLGAVPYDNLPCRNGSFFGRQSELDIIHAALLPDSISRQASVALYGLPGSGKSQLAVEYAYRKYEDETYQVVLWLPSETDQKLAQSVGSVCQGLGILDEKLQHDRERQKQTLLQWLAKTNRKAQSGRLQVKWLVVFDDVSDPSIVKPYWDVVSRGSSIITCRSLEIASRLPREKVHVEAFDPQAASNFLLSLVFSHEGHSEEDTELATTIAKAIGNHPLALNLIGCHIRRCGKSLNQFLADHPNFERDLLFRQNLTLGVEHINERTVSDVFALNSGNISMLPSDSHARLLLCLLAFLDPDGAPLSLFRGHNDEAMLCDGPDDLDDHSGVSQALQNPFESSDVFDQARSTLLDLGMITMDHKNAKIRCHRLVQIAAEISMTSDEISLILNKLVFFLNSAFPSQVDGQALLSQWGKCDEFAASVVSVLEACMRHKDMINQPALLSEVVCRCSWYYYEQGWFASSTRLADEAIAYCEHILSTGNHNGYTSWYVKDMISHQWNTKASIGMKRPESDHGHSMYQEVLRIRLENQRQGNPEDEAWIGAAVGNLAISLMATGRAEEALPKLRELAQRDYSKTKEDLYLSNLCLCFNLLSRFEESLIKSEAAAACIRRQWGDCDARMATVWFYAARAREGLGDYTGAEEALMTCLRVRKDLMPAHPETGFTHHRMGVFLNKRGNSRKAAEHLARAFTILSSCECHPGAICRTILEFWAVMERTGDLQFSEACTGLFQHYFCKITDADASGLSRQPSDYDRFVTVGLR